MMIYTREGGGGRGGGEKGNWSGLKEFVAVIYDLAEEVRGRSGVY